MELIVVIIGWFNVGKLIFFNRLVGKCVVLVDDMFGLIRDWCEGDVCLGDFLFKLIDMVGYENEGGVIFVVCM